ncbi:MAG: MBL fold metallo-hydrolase [Candidatus Woesearchaeota archaeon]|nr:MBL fold metallo-hydrolase [Candidatus Woesearchaeota archaeon]
MLDCGIDVASDQQPYPFLEAPEFKIDELDAIIITHSHLDHSGLLPYLFKFGYKGPVYCTAPTRDVMSLLQLDMIKIMINEGKEPLFSQDDVKEMVRLSGESIG